MNGTDSILPIRRILYKTSLCVSASPRENETHAEFLLRTSQARSQGTMIRTNPAANDAYR